MKLGAPSSLGGEPVPSEQTRTFRVHCGICRRGSQLGTDHCFTSKFMSYEYSVSNFGTVSLFDNVLLPVILFLNRDMAVFDDYGSSGVPRLTFLVTGCQRMRAPEAVVYEGIM